MQLLSAAIPILGSILANSGTGLEQGPVFVASAFTRLEPGTPELGKRFSWPETGTFRATHQRATAAAPIRFLVGQATVEGEGKIRRRQVFVAIDPTPGGGVVQVFAETAPGEPDITRALSQIPLQRWLASADKPISLASNGVKISVVAAAAGPAPLVDTAAWTDWTYTTTLLALPQPVYAPAPPGDNPWDQASAARERKQLARIQKAFKKGPAAVLAAITAALATSTEETGLWHASDWDEIATWAQKQQALEAAIGIRSRFRPVGRCSMDSLPQRTATSYADLCYAAGKLGCFLDLQVQVMGDQFRRVAYSSYGEAAHDTGVDRLRHIGIDPGRFLRGLVFRFAVPGADRRELDPWRLARSMKEAGLGPEMKTFLKQAAMRPDLDLFNRLRAAETYALLQFQTETPANRLQLDDKTRRAVLASIRADLIGFKLPEPLAIWASGFGQPD